MKLVILSRARGLYSTRRLLLVAQARGHEVSVLDPRRCSLVLADGGAQLSVRGTVVGQVDAVIPRGLPAADIYGTAVLRHFELSGAFPLNDGAAMARARDKLCALQILQERGLPLLPTAFARHPGQVRDAIARIGGTPCVVKFTHGTQGLGVMLAESAVAAESLADAFRTVDQPILLQRFVEARSDARLLVAGRRVVAAMRRTPRAGEFRANLHRGGGAEALQPTPEQSRLAIAATRALGLEVAGVDLLETPHGPAILEVNASPGLRGIEAASGRNVAGAIIAHLEKRVAGRAPVTAQVVVSPDA